MAFGKAKADIEALQRRACATDAQKRAVVDGRSAGSGAGGWALIGGVCALSFGALGATGLMAAGVVANPFASTASVEPSRSIAVTLATTTRFEPADTQRQVRALAKAQAARFGNVDCDNVTDDEIFEAHRRLAIARKRSKDAVKKHGSGAAYGSALGMFVGQGRKDFATITCSVGHGFADPPDRMRRNGESKNAYDARLKRENRAYARRVKALEKKKEALREKLKAAGVEVH